MKEFFTILAVLNIIVLIILVFFVLSKVRGVQYTIQKIKRVLKSEVISYPFDSVTVFNNLLRRLEFEDKPLDSAPRSKYIFSLYNKNNKKNAITKILTFTDKRDISQINEVLKLIKDFSYQPLDYHLREYKKVPFWVELHNESLRNVDPYDPTLDNEWKSMIIQEAKSNPLYYVEMIMSCPVGPIGEFIINLSDMIDKKTETVSEKFTRQLEEETEIEMSLKVAEKFNVGELNIIVAEAKAAGIKEITMEVAQNLLNEKNYKDTEKDYNTTHEDQDKAQYIEFLGRDENGLVRKVFIESGIVERLDSNIRSKLIDAAIYYKIERIDRMTMDEVICGPSVDDFDLNLIEVNAIKLIIQGHIERIPEPIAVNGSYDILLENHKRTIGRVVFDEESWEGFDHNTKVWLANTAVAREEYYMNPNLAAFLLKEREDRKVELNDKKNDKKTTPKSGSKVKPPEKKIKVESDNIEKEHKSEKIITD